MSLAVANFKMCSQQRSSPWQETKLPRGRASPVATCQGENGERKLVGVEILWGRSRATERGSTPLHALFVPRKLHSEAPNIVFRSFTISNIDFVKIALQQRAT
jgi:hypothetical protein